VTDIVILGRGRAFLSTRPLEGGGLWGKCLHCLEIVKMGAGWACGEVKSNLFETRGSTWKIGRVTD